MNTEYEVMFILNKNENIFQTSQDKIKEIFAEKEVTILSQEDLRIKELAYEVKKHKEGHYYLYKIKVDGLKMKEIDSELRLQEDILRYLFVKKEYKKKKFAKKKFNKK